MQTLTRTLITNTLRNFRRHKGPFRGSTKPAAFEFVPSALSSTHSVERFRLLRPFRSSSCVCSAMATQQQILSHLRSILRQADLETVTEEVLKGQLTSHFSEDMTQHEDVIMVQILPFSFVRGNWIHSAFFHAFQLRECCRDAAGMFTSTMLFRFLQTEVERFITSQAQDEAKGRKREQENCEPQPRKSSKQARTSMPTSTEPGVFILRPDGLQRCVVKEFKGQKYVDVRMYWKVCRSVAPLFVWFRKLSSCLESSGPPTTSL